MLAALVVARLRGAVFAAGVQNCPRWTSPDNVSPTELPLAKALEQVLASMHAVLAKTVKAMENAEAENAAALSEEGEGKVDSGTGAHDNNDEVQQQAKKKRLLKTKAAEVRVVRNMQDLRNPPNVDAFRAQVLEV
jgi:pyridoxine kinase